VQHDNFEALAIAREGDATILWIASDDNNAWWQQSLLLKFRLDLPPASARSGANRPDMARPAPTPGGSGPVP
jgi:hypothetical protein